MPRAAQPSVHRRCNRRLNAAAHFRGPRREISDFSAGFNFGVPIKRMLSVLWGFIRGPRREISDFSAGNNHNVLRNRRTLCGGISTAATTGGVRPATMIKFYVCPRYRLSTLLIYGNGSAQSISVIVVPDTLKLTRVEAVPAGTPSVLSITLPDALMTAPT